MCHSSDHLFHLESHSVADSEWTVPPNDEAVGMAEGQREWCIWQRIDEGKWQHREPHDAHFR